MYERHEMRTEPGWKATLLARVVATLALASLLAVSCGGSDGGPPQVEITAFEPASGDHYPGEAAVSSLRFENTGATGRAFWVGYSVRDGAGRWHDVPARRVTLEAGEEARREMRWRVPEEGPSVSGPYEVAMAVWDKEPGEGVTRLAGVREKGAFEAFSFREDFEDLDGERWTVSDKRLGRGSLDPRNVSVDSGRLRLKLPAETLDGGEIESRGLHDYGTYRARIEVADAPSSITGFFLYREPDFESEIDVEILGGSDGHVLFTTYSGGEETHTVRKQLPFDPTAGFHEYRFDFHPDEAVFYADGERLHSFSGGLPDERMRLLVNAWYPEWLSGERPGSDRYTYVDWIRH
jgi:hypothetical protein